MVLNNENEWKSLSNRFIGEYLQGCLKVSVDEQLGTATKRNLSK